MPEGPGQNKLALDEQLPEQDSEETPLFIGACDL